MSLAQAHPAIPKDKRCQSVECWEAATRVLLYEVSGTRWSAKVCASHAEEITDSSIVHSDKEISR